MTYWDINSDSLIDVRGVVSAIAAAEMLEKSQPLISAALGKYALYLIDNAIVIFGESPEFTDARQKIYSHIAGKPIADAKMLDRFGSAIYMEAESSPHKNELMGIAYLAFACTSIHGVMSKSVTQRMMKAEKMLEQSQTLPSNEIPSGYQPPQPQTPAQPQAPPQYPAAVEPEVFQPEDPKAQKLATIARESFAAGAYDIALTAMNALVKELENKI